MGSEAVKSPVKTPLAAKTLPGTLNLHEDTETQYFTVCLDSACHYAHDIYVFELSVPTVRDLYLNLLHLCMKTRELVFNL